VCAVHCVQLLHTILHRTDLIIFPLALQTITIAPMTLFEGRGGMPRHVCHGCLSWAGHTMTSEFLWRCLLMHAVHCSVVQYSRLIPLSVSPNSDESRKQSPYPDGDLDRHQNLITCSLDHYQPSLEISCKSVPKFLRKVANSQTTTKAYPPSWR